MKASVLLRSVRRSLQISQREFAGSAGFSQPFYADIERGAHDTSCESMERILNAHGFKSIAVPTTGRTASEWADYIFQELRSPRKSHNVAFRALIGLSDDLRDASKSLLVILTFSPPSALR